ISKIIEYLNLREQLQLWQATDSTSRLGGVVSYCWQRQNSHTVFRNTFEGIPAVLEDFLRCICSSVTVLTLNYLPMEQLELWKNHVFPNLRELYYMGDENGDEDDDSDIAILVKCFPQLESIGLSGNSSGQHISQWRNLRRLDMQLCWYLSTQCFEEICQNPRLQMLNIQWRRSEEDAYVQAILKLLDLEELEVDIVNLSQENTRQLMSLPKLRKLRLHHFDHLDDLLLDICRLRGHDVMAATFNDNIWMRPLDVLAKLYNLRSLTIIDDEGCIDIDFSALINCFPRLEQLHLDNSLIWSNADGIWSVVGSCPKLKLFAMSNMDLNEEFFAFSASTMNRVLDSREDPLVMHFYKTGSQISERFRHRSLKLSYGAKNYTYSQVPEDCMELELRPMES
ncbi:hypothetical protein KR009_000297, partial [Drosophila setifemur]